MKTSVVLPLLLLGVAGHAEIGMAQSTGTFTPTGNLCHGNITQQTCSRTARS